MGKLTIFMAMFNSYVQLPEGTNGCSWLSMSMNAWLSMASGILVPKNYTQWERLSMAIGIPMRKNETQRKRYQC